MVDEVSSHRCLGTCRWFGCAALLSLSSHAVADEQPVIDLGQLSHEDAGVGDLFGFAVAVDELFAVVGAPGSSQVAADAGAVYIFKRTSDGWASVQKLLPPAAQGGEFFGSAVDVQGSWILVGAPGADGSCPAAGAAYAYRFDGASWVRERSLWAVDGRISERFGSSVAIGDEHFFIGATHRQAFGVATGAVFTCEKEGAFAGVLRETRGHDTASGDLFGWHVAVDGDVLLVGAPGHSSAGTLSGASYVFERMTPSGGSATWNETAKLVASNAHAGATFGSSGHVAGERLCVGSPTESTEEFLSGAVYLFRRGANGWLEESMLKGEPTIHSARFGHALYMTSSTLLVGARLDPDPEPNCGRVFVFRDTGAGWLMHDVFNEPTAGFNHWFGAALDGHFGELLIGAPHASGAASNAGAVHALSAQPGRSFCAGDGGSTMCPCGNLGGVRRGCYNSSGVGALLYGEGSAHASFQDLELHGLGLSPSMPVILLVSDQPSANEQGQVFGDGLLCVGGVVRKLGLKISNVRGEVTWPALIQSDDVSWFAGQTRVFQMLYRDIPNSPCNVSFNTSNGYRVDLEP